MKITFILPAIGLHQLAISNELYQQLGDDFCFIATQDIRSGRFGLNYDVIADELPYVIKAYASEKEKKHAFAVISDSEAIIIGSSPMEYTDCANQNQKALLLRHSERFFKNGIWRRFVPKTRVTIKRQFLTKKDNLAVICSSAYLPYDLSFFTQKVRTFKWGYFPEINSYNLNKLMANKPVKAKILWAGRMLKLKHPELAIEVAEKLKNVKLEFQMTIIGEGELKEKLHKDVFHYHLEDCVTIKDAVETQELQREMVNSNIFLFTSDFREGWGAVLNEAMNAGCACIVSHAPGAVPFLICDGNNGVVYESGNKADFFQKVERVVCDQDFRTMLGRNANLSIMTDWNPKTAAQRLIQFTDEYAKTGEYMFFEKGPLSTAPIIQNNWYQGGKNDSK